MRKSRTPGSVRGVSGNGYPYRDIAVVTLCCSKNVRAWPAQRVDKPGAVIGTAFFRQSGSAKWTAIPPASAGQVYPARCRTDGPRFQRIR